MSLRLAALFLLASAAVARADEPVVSLVPSCAEVDPSDSLSDADRAVARRLLARVLERVDLLVVEAGCVDHYLVSHEAGADGFTLHLQGPQGKRRVRHTSADRFAADYARMVDSLIVATHPTPTESATAPQSEAPSAEPSTEAQTTEDGSAEPAEDAREQASPDASQTPLIDAVPPDAQVAVRPDRLIYGRLGIGTYGVDHGIGYRRGGSAPVAVDASINWASNDNGGIVAGKLEALYVQRPTAPATFYFGGGFSLAHADHMDAAGMRLEATAGLEFARAGTFRWFTQFDLGLGYASTGNLSVGVGF